MSRAFFVPAALVAPLALALAGCGSNPPQRPTQVVVQQPQTPTKIEMPSPPPPPHGELVPPPPQGAGNVAWQPGHWRYIGTPGNPWFWVGGRYTPAQPGRSQWTRGRWVEEPQGGWTWVEGHWS